MMLQRRGLALAADRMVALGAGVQGSLVSAETINSAVPQGWCGQREMSLEGVQSRVQGSLKGMLRPGALQLCFLPLFC